MQVTCRCFGLDLSALGRAMELIVGLPDYEAYTAHLLNAHPDQKPLSRDAFFRERQAARFGSGGGLRCC